MGLRTVGEQATGAEGAMSTPGLGKTAQLREFDITVDDGSSVEPPVGMEEG